LSEDPHLVLGYMHVEQRRTLVAVSSCLKHEPAQARGRAVSERGDEEVTVGLVEPRRELLQHIIPRRPAFTDQ